MKGREGQRPSENDEHNGTDPSIETVREKEMNPERWWFDACGLSNLNGVYYHAPNNKHKMDGIRWHYFKGPSYSLRASRLMIRPSGI
ncbi:Angiopoietin-4 [Saguinus oedipus]|uniref:Angiopoietin-4 n=1 Tax=Saguinus oedipus TaxID=9490 RepID=A0ABQ9VK58_SAGOE|nr:Angiopoietin-4 [Saguinus oedipus]